jgi:hypothetical protein
MVYNKWTTKYKTLMTSSKIPRLLRLHRATRWHLKSAPCMTMMCLLSIKLPPPLHNECLVQEPDDRGPAHCVVLPSGIDGVDMERNAPVPSAENINTLNGAPIGMQEVATHPMPPSQPRQLFKSSANVPRRPVCIQPPMHPTLVVPNPSPRV